MAAITTQTSPLPGRLMNFFARYPPKLHSSHSTGMAYPITKAKSRLSETRAAPSLSNPEAPVSIASNTSSNDPNAPAIESTSIPPVPSHLTASNPFLPWKNPETGRWRGAVISLRRQAELVKLAKQYGVEPLLPPGRKSTVFKEHRALELGLRVKGVGKGQTVKGHKWERTMNATLEKRRNAMEGMPQLIQKWKQLGHGRGWKKYPSSKGM